MGTFDVPPGKTFGKRIIDLQPMFELPPGTYTIQATLKLPRADGERVVKVSSNEISLSIVSK